MRFVEYVNASTLLTTLERKLTQVQLRDIVLILGSLRHCSGLRLSFSKLCEKRLARLNRIMNPSQIQGCARIVASLSLSPPVSPEVAPPSRPAWQQTTGLPKTQRHPPPLLQRGVSGQ